MGKTDGTGSAICDKTGRGSRALGSVSVGGICAAAFGGSEVIGVECTSNAAANVLLML